MARWIAGMDGCRGGWAGVLLDLDDPRRHRVGFFETVAALMDAPEAPAHVGIDIPIGLPERIVGGGRAPDIAARAYLGRHGRGSVFPVPPRAAVEAGSYDEAKALSRAASDPPFAPSIQCWNICAKIRDVDALLIGRPNLVARLHEVHPEVAFRRLNGGHPLGAGKKTLPGRDERRALLLAAGLPPDLVGAGWPARVGADDGIDALAALVVARDIARGVARALPDPWERDERGLPVVIWMPA